MRKARRRKPRPRRRWTIQAGHSYANGPGQVRRVLEVILENGHPANVVFEVTDAGRGTAPRAASSRYKVGERGVCLYRSFSTWVVTEITDAENESTTA